MDEMLQIADAMRRRGAKDRGHTLVECPCGIILEVRPDGNGLRTGTPECNCGNPIQECPTYQSPYTN